MTSSSRFEGVPVRRSSSAFDGSDATAWVGDLVPAGAVLYGEDRTQLPLAAAVELFDRRLRVRPPRWDGELAAPYPWLAIRGPRAVTLRQVRLVRASAEYAFPSVVRIDAGGRIGRPLRVGPDGLVRLPAPVRARDLRITVLRVAPPRGAAGGRLLRAVGVAEVRSALRPPPIPRTGTFSLPCGTLTARGAAGALPLRAAGDVAALDDGQPLRISGCGRLTMPAGSSPLSVAGGVLLRADHLLLDAPAAEPVANPPSGGLAVVIGHARGSGVADRARLRLAGPAWVVLGQGYSRGWRASCTDASGHRTAVGPAQAVDGFAAGWRVPASCTTIAFAFAPQKAADAGYLLSLLALPLLGLLALRGRRAVRAPAPAPVALPDPLYRLSWGRSLLVGLVVTVIVGFLFGLPLGPLSVLVARRGVRPRALYRVGAAALAAIPVLYIVRDAPDLGGFGFGYPVQNLWGNWAAVIGLTCIAGGAVLDLLSRRRREAPVMPPWPVTPTRDASPQDAPPAAAPAPPR
jgi:hypothetical protein